MRECTSFAGVLRRFNVSFATVEEAVDADPNLKVAEGKYLPRVWSPDRILNPYSLIDNGSHDIAMYGVYLARCFLAVEHQIVFAVRSKYDSTPDFNGW